MPTCLAANVPCCQRASISNLPLSALTTLPLMCFCCQRASTANVPLLSIINVHLLSLPPLKPPRKLCPAGPALLSLPLPLPLPLLPSVLLSPHRSHSAAFTTCFYYQVHLSSLLSSASIIIIIKCIYHQRASIINVKQRLAGTSPVNSEDSSCQQRLAGTSPVSLTTSISLIKVRSPNGGPTSPGPEIFWAWACSHPL
jgi:hypothetical protein